MDHEDPNTNKRPRSEPSSPGEAPAKKKTSVLAASAAATPPTTNDLPAGHDTEMSGTSETSPASSSVLFSPLGFSASSARARPHHHRSDAFSSGAAELSQVRSGLGLGLVPSQDGSTRASQVSGASLPSGLPSLAAGLPSSAAAAAAPAAVPAAAPAPTTPPHQRTLAGFDFFGATPNAPHGRSGNDGLRSLRVSLAVSSRLRALEESPTRRLAGRSAAEDEDMPDA